MKQWTMPSLRSNAGGTFPSSVVALGNFDGVHLGHRALLRAALSEKERSGVLFAVFTFETPAGKESCCLLTREQRLWKLEEQGADAVLLAEFEEVRHLPPERFVNEILYETMHASCCVCGFNYRFGVHASGDAETLTRLCGEKGIRVIVQPPVTTADGVPISSSRIRETLRNGEMEQANAMLGSPYTLSLPVLHGQALGRTIGIPTANQCFPDGMVIPKRGVYASFVTLGKDVCPAVTNIGVRPTVSGEGVTAETHLIGYDGDLYGQTIAVSLERYLRPETKFPSLEKLKQAIFGDIEAAKQQFENRNGGSVS